MALSFLQQKVAFYQEKTGQEVLFLTLKLAKSSTFVKHKGLFTRSAKFGRTTQKFGDATKVERASTLVVQHMFR
jgi:hypothetical protein